MSSLFFSPSCPSGGTWFVCNSSESKFIGCCESNDPCTSSNGCPAGNLKPATFDPAYFGKFHDQKCSDGLFHTCKDPGFLGCCKEDPCKPGGCPAGKLAGAYLSNEPDEAKDFLGSSAVSSSTARLSTTFSTSTALSSSTLGTTSTISSSREAPTGSVDLSQGMKPGHRALPTGALVGIAIGVALLLAILGVLFYLWRYTAKLGRSVKGQNHSKYSIADTSGRPSPDMPPATPGKGVADTHWNPTTSYLDAQLNQTYQAQPGFSPTNHNHSGPRYSTVSGMTGHSSMYSQSPAELETVELGRRSELYGSSPLLSSPTVRIVPGDEASTVESQASPSSDYVAYHPERYGRLIPLAEHDRSS